MSGKRLFLMILVFLIFFNVVIDSIIDILSSSLSATTTTTRRIGQIARENDIVSNIYDHATIEEFRSPVVQPPTLNSAEPESPRSLPLLGDIRTPTVVTGIAYLDGRIYVSHQSNSILVFNGSSPTFDQIDVIVIEDLRLATDLAADTHRKLLYVSDITRKIWKVDPNVPTSASFFDTDGFMPASISFCQRSSQLIVVGRGNRKLFVYGVNDGDGVRTAVVRLPDNLEPQHAVCTRNGNYLVAHTGLAMVNINKYHQVTEFDATGVNVRSYGDIFSGSRKGQLKTPRYLPVIEDGSVMVADYGNGRVVRLSDELEYLETVVQGVPVTHLSVATPQRHLLVGQKMNIGVYQLQ